MLRILLRRLLGTVGKKSAGARALCCGCEVDVFTITEVGQLAVAKKHCSLSTLLAPVHISSAEPVKNDGSRSA